MMMDLPGSVLVVPVDVLLSLSDILFRQRRERVAPPARHVAWTQPPPAPPPPHAPPPPPREERPAARSGEGAAAEVAVSWPPRIVTLGTSILCNGAELDLAQRPLTMRLFAAFCASADFELSLGEIVARVYHIDPRASDDLHYTDKTYGRSVRLLSRARSLAKRHLSAQLPPGVEWFAYNQSRRRWQLCALVCQPADGVPAPGGRQA